MEHLGDLKSFFARKNNSHCKSILTKHAALQLQKNSPRTVVTEKGEEQTATAAVATATLNYDVAKQRRPKKASSPQFVARFGSPLMNLWTEGGRGEDVWC